MNNKSTSVLIVSPDTEFQIALTDGLFADKYDVTSKYDTVTGLNGKLSSLAASQDIVLFDLYDDITESLEAVREMNANRGSSSVLIALADESLPLSKARELSHAGVDNVLPRHALNEEILPQIEASRARQNAQIPALWAGHATEGKVIAIAQFTWWRWFVDPCGKPGRRTSV